MFRVGYILGRRADWVWFIGLPFLAIAAALASQRWLPAVALASVALWITVPHHFATWLRTYGLREDWRRWKDRLIVGPPIIAASAFAGLVWAPMSLVLVITLWDHQHSLMQQHGFARIYDFKARAGAPSTPRFDLFLNWILYVNLLLTAPLFTQFWVREVYRWGLPISVETIRSIQLTSWTVTGLFGFLYLGHVCWCVKQGYPLNPLKYLFIGSSYFLWYFVAWLTTSFLVQGIAHRIMHGLQYIVMVHSYIRRKEDVKGEGRGLLARLVQPSTVWAFVLMSLFYAFIYQLLTNQPLRQFGFGVVNFTSEYFTSQYHAIPSLGLSGITPAVGYDLFASMLISTAAMTHYYFDSFIWKVRDTKIQEGL